MDQLLPQMLRDVIDDDLARAYSWPAPATEESAVAETGAPFIRANMVSSIDGVAAVKGVSASLSSPDDQRLFAILRDLADLVLVGAGTVRQEGYGPSVLSPARQRRRQRWTDRGPLPYAVITNTGLDPDLSFFQTPKGDGARPIVITHAAAADQVRLDRCELVIAGEERVDLPQAKKALGDLGFRHVLCEGGPGLLGSLISQELIDELCLSVSPLLVGAGSGPGLIGNTQLADPVNWTLAGLHSGTNSLFARYRRVITSHSNHG